MIYFLLYLFKNKIIHISLYHLKASLLQDSCIVHHCAVDRVARVHAVAAAWNTLECRLHYQKIILCNTYLLNEQAHATHSHKNTKSCHGQGRCLGPGQQGLGLQLQEAQGGQDEGERNCSKDSLQLM